MEEKKKDKEEIDEAEAFSAAASEAFESRPGASVALALGHEEEKALKKHGIFDLLRRQSRHEEGKSKDVFKVVQGPDQKKQLVKRFASLRYMRTAGVTHYDSSGIRHFTVGNVLYNTILMYVVNETKYVKVVLHRVTDSYRDRSISTSFICDELRPYTLKSELELDEDRLLILKNAVYCVESLVNDYINKDFINYSKTSMKTLMIVGGVCVFFGFGLGALVGIAV